ncbi:MAG: PGPGW domain-containing protein [Nanoarchaeota archaeon]
MIRRIARHARRLVVFVIGSTVLLFGIILIFTPGPAIIVIPIGLAILATEFVWAELLLHKIKEKLMRKNKK